MRACSANVQRKGGGSGEAEAVCVEGGLRYHVAYNKQLRTAHYKVFTVVWTVSEAMTSRRYQNV